MIIHDGDTVAHINEDRFIELSTTSALNHFNVPALRLMYRWYEDVARQSAHDIEFDAYNMTRQWRELTGRTLVADYGRPGERRKTDAATIQAVLARVQAQTAVIRVADDDYLVHVPNLPAAA